MQRVFWVSVLTLVIGSSVVGCHSTTIIRQSGVIPHPRPAVRSGQNIYDGRVQLYHHSSALTGVDRSRSGQKDAAANRISGYIGGGGLRVRLGENWDIGAFFEIGSRGWTHTVAKELPAGSCQKCAPFALGLDVSYSLPLTQWFRLAFALELPIYGLPNKEYTAASCEPPDFAGCGGGDTDWDGAAGVALSFVPSFRVTEWLTLFLGVDVRLLPRFNDVIVVESENLQTTEHDNVLAYGAVSVGGGAEFRLAPRVRVLLSVYQPLNKDPVAFGPVVGASLSFALGTPVAEEPEVRYRRQHAHPPASPPPSVQTTPPAPPPSSPPAAPPRPDRQPAPLSDPPGEEIPADPPGDTPEA
jgi:hypothetical protein